MRARQLSALVTVKRGAVEHRLLVVADAPAGASLMSELRDVEAIDTATGQPWGLDITGPRSLSAAECEHVQLALSADLARQLRDVHRLGPVGTRIAASFGWPASLVATWLQMAGQSGDA